MTTATLGHNSQVVTTIITVPPDTGTAYFHHTGLELASSARVGRTHLVALSIQHFITAVESGSIKPQAVGLLMIDLSDLEVIAKASARLPDLAQIPKALSVHTTPQDPFHRVLSQNQLAMTARINIVAAVSPDDHVRPATFSHLFGAVEATAGTPKVDAGAFAAALKNIAIPASSAESGTRTVNPAAWASTPVGQSF